MKDNESKTPWWAKTLIGALIVIASILLLFFLNEGLDVLVVLVSLGVLVYAIYNVYKAFKSRYDNNKFVAHLVHGLLNIVLLILIIVIRDTPALLGVIIASWFIVFGVFEIIGAWQEKSENNRRARIGTLLILIGIALIAIPLLLSINYVLLFGIVALIYGIVKVVKGIMIKTQYDQRTSGGRSHLI